MSQRYKLGNMNATVKETIESLQNLIRELRKYPEDATVSSLYYHSGVLRENQYYEDINITQWKIGDVTENSVDVLLF